MKSSIEYTEEKLKIIASLTCLPIYKYIFATQLNLALVTVDKNTTFGKIC